MNTKNYILTARLQSWFLANLFVLKFVLLFAGVVCYIVINYLRLITPRKSDILSKKQKLWPGKYFILHGTEFDGKHIGLNRYFFYFFLDKWFVNLLFLCILKLNFMINSTYFSGLIIYHNEWLGYKKFHSDPNRSTFPGPVSR